jgi:hypothetical protein
MPRDRSRRERDTERAAAVASGVLALASVSVGIFLMAVETDYAFQGAGVPPYVRAQVFVMVGVCLGGIATMLWLASLPPGKEGELGHEPEAWICPQCWRPYVPGAHFCPRCAAPLTVFANTAPYERIYATAWRLGLGAHHPRGLLQALGMLILTVPVLLGALAVPAIVAFKVLAAWEILRPWPFGSLLAELVFSLPMIGLLYHFVMNVGKPRHQRRWPWWPYGSPPYWTHDVEWALPEEVLEEEEPTA